MSQSKKKSKVVMNEKHFLDKKHLSGLSGTKKEPVWVYLEREMQEMAAKNIKPYNKKVGDWLKFLKELKYYFFVEAKKIKKALKNNVGPIWFFQLSPYQVEVLKGLKDDMHQDIILGLPEKTQRALYELGLYPKPPNNVVMRAMLISAEDPGLFIWNLYKLLFGHEPVTAKTNYSMNAMILMSGLVGIDLEECIDELEKLSYGVTPPNNPHTPKMKPNKIPHVKYGVYLQIPDHIPCIGNKPSYGPKQQKKPIPIEYKFKLRTESQIEKARLDMKFLKLRADRCKEKKEDRKVSNYKFWEPPARIKSKADAQAVALQALFKKKPIMAAISPSLNLNYNIGGVAYSGGCAYYIISGAVTTSTPYIPVHGGMVSTKDGYAVPYIQGAFQIPVKEYICDDECHCMRRYHDVIDYLKDSKCTCGHLYDFNHEGKCKTKFFTPPSRHGPFFFDLAKIFRLDSREDFIKHAVELTAHSTSQLTVSTAPSLPSCGMTTKEVLSTFLADLSRTPLILPHLPDVVALPGLIEWCRKRRFGEASHAEKTRDLIYCKRKWDYMKRTNFRESAYRIPFTEKELRAMNWSHRKMVGNMFTILLNDFVLRNRIKQVEHTRFFWPTMQADKFPNKSFIETYFTYMPSRLQDIYFYNPYCPALSYV